MDDESYRNELRNHFIGQMKNSKFQVSRTAATKAHRSLTYDSSPIHTNSKSSAQQYKDFTMRQQQKAHDLDNAYSRRHHQPQQQQQQQHQQHQHQHQHPHQQLQRRRSSGGDADRVLYESNFAMQHNHTHESYRRVPGEAASYVMRPMQPKMKEPNSAPPITNSSTHNKYSSEEQTTYMYETDSNMGAASDESGKSQKSSKTVVSKKSSQDLRKIVKSQCKLHEVIDETLKKMCGPEGGEPIGEEVERHVIEQPLQMPMSMPIPPLHCKRCSDKSPNISRSSQKDVMTEIAKGDFLDCRSGDTLTISVDDVVNSKVINPMIRKLQRMYLNNLKEEMSLMEDLERLPHKVNEVYKATIFKQKD